MEVAGAVGKRQASIVLSREKRSLVYVWIQSQAEQADAAHYAASETTASV